MASARERLDQTRKLIAHTAKSVDDGLVVTARRLALLAAAAAGESVSDDTTPREDMVLREAQALLERAAKLLATLERS